MSIFSRSEVLERVALRIWNGDNLSSLSARTARQPDSITSRLQLETLSSGGRHSLLRLIRVAIHLAYPSHYGRFNEMG